MYTNEDFMSFFIDLQDNLHPTMAIEVGAFDADFSNAICKKGVKSYAFEASPYIYDRFRESMGQITYINKAISNFDGTIQFEIIEKNNPSLVGNNSIKNRSEDTQYSYIEVDSVSLNSYFKDIQDENIVLWIDCEGANEEVLTGASDILPFVSSIYIETEQCQFWKDQWLHDDVVNYLAGFGFKVLESRFAYENQQDTIFIK